MGDLLIGYARVSTDEQQRTSRSSRRLRIARSALSLVCASVVLWMITAPVALADGAKTIAGAPVIAPGQQEFGNDANGAEDVNQVFDSWWILNVSAGDHITISWEAQLDSQGRGPALLIYPAGTTDFNVGNTALTTYQFLNSNGKNQLNLTASVDGAIPVDLQADGNINLQYEEYPPGPYDFTVTVQHALVASLSVTGSSRRSHQTSFRVGVRSPDGVAISNPNLRTSVQRLFHHKWMQVATFGAPATFHATWARSQRGKWQYIRAQVYGPGYVTATSQTVRVKSV
jgi:hypothetical protein